MHQVVAHPGRHGNGAFGAKAATGAALPRRAAAGPGANGSSQRAGRPLAVEN
ncbi:hypothetical protein RBY4I_3058 [Rhodobacterales bacterium Y4I]|nr:hypothetical protein RBY4I_3058 [Rhodobacterales bacterium Y4I]